MRRSAPPYTRQRCAYLTRALRGQCEGEGRCVSSAPPAASRLAARTEAGGLPGVGRSRWFIGGELNRHGDSISPQQHPGRRAC